MNHHYKTEFSDPLLTFKKISATEWFRFSEGVVPLLRLESGKYTSFHNGLILSACESAPVVRIRIDRVEDGLPVFVDA